MKIIAYTFQAISLLVMIIIILRMIGFLDQYITTDKELLILASSGIFVGCFGFSLNELTVHRRFRVRSIFWATLMSFLLLLAILLFL
jgi:hypothetical protein